MLWYLTLACCCACKAICVSISDEVVPFDETAVKIRQLGVGFDFLDLHPAGSLFESLPKIVPHVAVLSKKRGRPLAEAVNEVLAIADQGNIMPPPDALQDMDRSQELAARYGLRLTMQRPKFCRNEFVTRRRETHKAGRPSAPA